MEENWFVEGSYEETIKNLLRAADKEYVRRITLDKFREDLLNELKFLGYYSPDKFLAVEAYVRENILLLYEFVLQRKNWWKDNRCFLKEQKTLRHAAEFFNY